MQVLILKMSAAYSSGYMVHIKALYSQEMVVEAAQDPTTHPLGIWMRRILYAASQSLPISFSLVLISWVRGDFLRADGSEQPPAEQPTATWRLFPKPRHKDSAGWTLRHGSLSHLKGTSDRNCQLK